MSRNLKDVHHWINGKPGADPAARLARWIAFAEIGARDWFRGWCAEHGWQPEFLD